jgi:ribosomal protein S18 acetylase RimI-like enzyme
VGLGGTVMAAFHLSIRPLQDTDLTPVARLWFESWQSTGLDVAQRDDEALFQRRIRQELDRWEAYVACREAEPVGFLALNMQDACLDQLFIAPHCQGQRVGRLLLKFAEQRLPNGFWLRTGVDNRGACAFYDAQGLSRAAVESHPRLGIPMVIYKRQPDGSHAPGQGVSSFQARPG